MKLKKIVRESKWIQTIIEKPNDEGHMETFDVTSHEAPHPEMDRALEELPAVVSQIMEFKSVAGIAVHSLSISYTKHGTRSASIGFTRTIGATENAYKDTTVYFQFDDPADGEDRVRQCKKGESDLIISLMNEAFRYAKGERQNILLPLEDPKAEPKNGEKESGEGDLFEGGEGKENA